MTVTDMIAVVLRTLSAIEKELLVAKRNERARLHLQRLALIEDQGLGDVDLREKEALVSATAPNDGIDIRLALGRIAIKRGQYAAAQRIATAMQGLVSATDPYRCGQIQRLDAFVKWHTGQTQQAVQAFASVIKLFTQAADVQAIASATNDRGLLRGYLGDFSGALQDHQEALGYANLSEALRGQIQNDLGFALWNLARHDEALAALQIALKLRGEDHHGLGVTLNNLGNVYRSQSNLDAAEDHYQRAVALCRTSKNRLHEAIALNNLGQVCAARGDHKGAIARYMEALILSKEIGDRIREADNHGNLGAALLAQGQANDAILSLERAVNMRRQLKDVAYLVSDLARLGLAWLRVGDKESAKHALTEVEQLLASSVEGVEDRDAVLRICEEIRLGG